jgi:hypothetical protein
MARVDYIKMPRPNHDILSIDLIVASDKTERYDLFDLFVWFVLDFSYLQYLLEESIGSFSGTIDNNISKLESNRPVLGLNRFGG